MNDYRTMKEAKEKGTRLSNKDAARDVTWTVDQMLEELLNLERRTGARGIVLVAGSHPNDTIAPTCIGSDESLSFVSSILKLPPASLASKFEAFNKLKDKGLETAAFAKKCAAVVEGINDGLRNITKKPSLRMEYVDYEKRIESGEGVRLTGWPSKCPFRAPSNAGQGGAEAIDSLLAALRANTLRWEIIPADEREVLVEKYKDAPKKPRKPRTKKSTRIVDSDNEDEDEDEEEEVVKKKSKGKVAVKNKAKSNGGKRKQETDAAKPSPKKSKKNVGNASKPTKSKPAQKTNTVKPTAKRKAKPGGLEVDEEEEDRSRKRKRKGPTEEERSDKATQKALERLLSRRKAKAQERKAKAEEKAKDPKSTPRTLAEINGEEDDDSSS
ncbi:hypothetical protein GGX14DRAFT_573123 [Mycena pura]|uniref:Uncharacterized protein n=1 Tax=Mycena pura TaxID=153505 RepID=A0AAD6V0K4_9AGAR|nr:hypothetical protein GGX14DRAFT_573123 [Mycena pura]